MIREMQIVLASASDRRKELLLRLGIEFKVMISDFDEESVNFDGDCSKYVQKLATGKVLDISNKLQDTSGNIIIGCDTIVSINDNVLLKPKNKKEAFLMLKSLSGKEHQVYSGITLLNTEDKSLVSDFECTRVVFSKLTDETINWYIETGEPMDKAGAYGIQGYAGAFVKEIHGCYYNVVGLPLNKLCFMLRGMGVNLYKGAK